MTLLRLLLLVPIAVISYWLGGLVLSAYFKPWKNGVAVARWLGAITLHALALVCLSLLWGVL